MMLNNYLYDLLSHFILQIYMIIGKKEMQMLYYLFDCVIFVSCY